VLADSATLWTDENYSHGLLIPFVIGYILWTQRRRLASEARFPFNFLGNVPGVGRVFALWAGTAARTLCKESRWLSCCGRGCLFWGARMLRLMLVPLALLFLAIPIPAILLNRISFLCSYLASQCAVWSAAGFRYSRTSPGDVIELMPLGARETRDSRSSKRAAAYAH